MCLERWVSCRHTASVNHRIACPSRPHTYLSDTAAFPRSKRTHNYSVCIIVRFSRQMGSLAAAHVCTGKAEGESYPTEERGCLRGAV